MTAIISSSFILMVLVEIMADRMLRQVLECILDQIIRCKYTFFANELFSLKVIEHVFTANHSD